MTRQHHGLESSPGGSGESTGKAGVRPWIFRLVGPLVLLLILSRLDFKEILAALQRASVALILAGYFISLPSLLLRAARWRGLLRSRQIPSAFFESLNVYAYSVLLGTVTPARAGELVRMLHLDQKGASRGTALFCVVMDRFYDLAVLGLVGAAALLTSAPLERRFTLLLGVSIGVAGLAVLYLITRDPEKLRFLGGLAPERLRRPAARLFGDFIHGLSGSTWAGALAAGGLTAAAWVLNYSTIYLFGLAFGFDISYVEMAGITSLATLATFVPVSILGLGTRDITLIALLSKHGVPAADALAFSTICLSFTLVTAVACSYSLLTPVARHYGFSRASHGTEDSLAARRPAGNDARVAVRHRDQSS